MTPAGGPRKTPQTIATATRRPILLDLNGNGIEIAGADRSTTFVTGDDGLQHRTAWAGVGDGVLFLDAGMDGRITESREYVFTEWGERRKRNGPVDHFRRRTRGAPGRRPTAKDDMAALRARFDRDAKGFCRGNWGTT